MIYNFCTLFDKNYLPRGLSMYKSLKENIKNFSLWIVCFDDYTYDILTKMKLDCVIPVSLKEFEDEELKIVKKTRSAVEYCWTCTPSVPLYILNNYKEVDMITYLDADLFFYNDISKVFQEFQEKSIMITEHRYDAQSYKMKKTSGIYNVQFMTFRRDKDGIECLNWWRDRCNEWCYAKIEDGKFGDQKYLDDWPERFNNVYILPNKGAGLAPWNLGNYIYSLQNKKVYVNDEPLTFYHFHALKMYNLAELTMAQGYSVKDETLVKHVYIPYIESLRESIEEVKKIDLDFNFGFEGENKVEKRAKEHHMFFDKWIDKLQEGKEIDQYLYNNGIKNVAIYGFGSIGRKLYNNLKHSKFINIRCIIDNNVSETLEGVSVPICRLTEVHRNMNIDSVIVTPICDFDYIEKDICNNNINYKIVSLKDIILDM